MMLKCFILIWITVFKLCYCQQKMGLGNESILGKKYLVYFVKSPYSNADDDAWICAGAIVTPTQILTAAACLVEMNRIYAIAGYKKYIHGRDIDKDNCTNTWKKKIVKISVPKEYSKSTGKQVEWMNVDVGVATVQEPYNFDDQSYLTHCSYLPGKIIINYDKQNELEKTRAMALGWGGEKVKNVKEITKEKLKPQLLQEATTTIIGNSFCANLVGQNGSKEIVNKYLLCASGNGFLGEDWEETTLYPILEERPISSITVPNKTTESASTNKDIDSGQQNTANKTSKQINQANDLSSRKSSLLVTCQNDHGGPLVAWVGTEEIILGVALNGICNPNFDCVGPRIYVSTAATAKIIKCLLETNETSRKTCNDQIDEERYQVNDIEIKWPEGINNSTAFPQSIQQIPSCQQRQTENAPQEIRQQRDPRKVPNENPQETRHDYLHRNPKANHQETLDKKPEEKIHVSYRATDPQLNPYYNSSQASQTIGNASEKLEHKNRIIIQRRQTQEESQIRPQINNFNQFQSHNSYYKQPPINTNYNPPQTESKYPIEKVSINQPKTNLYDHRLAQINNQKVMNLYSQLHMGLFKELHMTTQNKSQRPFNKFKSISKQALREMNNNTYILKPPEMESYQSSQGHLSNHPQISLFKTPHIESFNLALENRLRLSQLKQLPALNLAFNMPQNIEEQETFKGTVSPQTKAVLLSTSQYLNKEPTQSPYNHIQIETVKPEPTQTFNPLNIIMSQTEQLDDLYKHIMEEPHSPLNVEPLQHQLNSPNNVQPSPSQTSQQNSALYPLQGDSQTFQHMLPQYYASTPELSAPVPAEIFDEFYRQIHDGQNGEPRNQKVESQFQQPNERKVEQIDAKVINEHPENLEEPLNIVQMRKQKPLQYPDYI